MLVNQMKTNPKCHHVTFQVSGRKKAHCVAGQVFLSRYCRAQYTRHEPKPNISRPALLLDQDVHNRERFDFLDPKHVIK